VIDRVDPSVYQPESTADPAGKGTHVAVVGAGPAGLAAAHDLSRLGYSVTVFEKDSRPGGMLVSAIPPYRLPRDVLSREIESILNENIELKCNQALGRDFTLDQLLKGKYRAVFVATGAHQSLPLNVENENTPGVFPAMEFLKSFHLSGKKLAVGRVGVIGGGNAAIDAARVALRQDGVEGVTIFYRRSRHEMPAFREEIEAALEEGVKIEELCTPVKINARQDRISSIEFIRNRLGEMDKSGRRRPVPVPGSGFTQPVDTLIVAIGEKPDIALKVDGETLEAGQKDVFAGGDIVTGPNTVIDAVAAGKKAAVVIHRYLTGAELRVAAAVARPSVYIEPLDPPTDEAAPSDRPKPSLIPVLFRKGKFDEVEMPMSAEEALLETRRCLRCDLEFTQPQEESQ
jgi:NADH-quinone oxidoreductase subunit F